MQPRVFVSSVIDGFAEYREAARRGIINAGGEPVLVEYFPSLALSPRNVCLDGVVSCDVFVVIVGNRGGSVSPSGRLVVEEEYEEARRRKIHILAFIQNTKQDKLAESLAGKLSDYVDGGFRQTFVTPDDLQKQIEKALKPIIRDYSNPKANMDMLNEKLSNSYEIRGETVMRLVLVPERIEEFIDPVDLESPELRNQILQIGHSPQVQLFSYERSKKTEIEVNSIIILQSEESRHQQFVDEVRLELTTEGLSIVDTNVTNCVARDRLQEMYCSMVILEDDIVGKLNKCFAFIRDFFETKDRFKRYNRFLYNVALSGIGHRTLISKPPQGNSSYSMNNYGNKVIITFDKPRLITRECFVKPEKEIDAVLTILRRRMTAR